MKPESLKKFLADADCTGIYHVPPGGHEALATAADALDFAFFDVQLGESEDIDSALGALGQGLGFPEWYGANFDALNDCLSDFSWRDAPGYVLILSGADTLRSAAPTAFATLNEVFAEAILAWREDGIPFWVFYDLRSNGLASLPTLA